MIDFIVESHVERPVTDVFGYVTNRGTGEAPAIAG